MEVGLGHFLWPCLPLQLSPALFLLPTPRMQTLNPWASILVYLPSLLPMLKQKTPRSGNRMNAYSADSAGKHPEHPGPATAGFNCLLKVRDIIVKLQASTDLSNIRTTGLLLVWAKAKEADCRLVGVCSNAGGGMVKIWI